MKDGMQPAIDAKNKLVAARLLRSIRPAPFLFSGVMHGADSCMGRTPPKVLTI